VATPYHLPKKRGVPKNTRISFFEGHVSHIDHTSRLGKSVGLFKFEFDDLAWLNSGHKQVNLNKL